MLNCFTVCLLFIFSLHTCVVISLVYFFNCVGLDWFCHETVIFVFPKNQSASGFADLPLQWGDVGTFVV